MIQFFGLNLKVGKPLRRTFPLIDAKSGSIELEIEAIPKCNDIATIQNHAITELYNITFMTVGPVIGTVTSSCARVLVECSKSINLNVSLFEICGRSHFDVEDSLFIIKSKCSHPKSVNKTLASIPKKEAFLQKTFNIQTPNIPFVFQLDGLKPDTVYRIEFDNVCNFSTRTGIIKTMIDEEKLARNPELAHQLTINCVSCNFIEKREPGKDAWQRIYENIDDTDILLHMGDQIYADYGHNAYDESMKICNSRNKVSQEEEELIKEEFRKYYRFNWNHIATRNVVSQVSNLMILDDHEIRDDWGSKQPDQTPGSAPYYVGSLAREVYWEYQRSLRGDVSNKEEIFKKHEAYYNLIGDTGIVVLDLRASRSFLEHQAGSKLKFMTEDQWNDLENWVFKGPLSSPQVKSLIIVCSVPLIFLNKRITDKLPKLNTELDDFKDHFVFGDNFPEQLKLLELMKAWKEIDSNRNGIFLGGDVHIGGSTSIFKDGKLVCEQLTSSAVCNDIVPLIELTLLKVLMQASDELVNGWSFKHSDWHKERNYGLIQVGVNVDKKYIVNSYLNTYKDAFIK